MPHHRPNAGFLFIFLTLFLISCQKPPLTTLSNARAALDSASAAGALRYAEKPYREAEATLQKGWLEVGRQNGRIGLFRNYRLADSLLTRVIILADSAARLARERAQESLALAQSETDALRNELATWREALNGSLVIYKAEQIWSEADLSLKMSDRLILEREYEAALQAVSNGREALVRLGDLLTEYANDVANQKKDWNRWVRETLEESRVGKGYAVIVDKTAHKVYLVKNGSLFKMYNCEVGHNSARQKMFAGDGATPEGKYKVVKSKQNGSKYYKALLLDFPNSTDRRRFQENKARGLISSRARIGANIEIHGGGGLDRDWTDGCVALTNSDMDSIMKYVGVGTPVTIVRKSEQFPP